MTPQELYRLEAERRGIRREVKRLTLKELAARVGTHRRVIDYHRRVGALKAHRVHTNGERWQWMIDADEAERFAREYRWNARRPGVVHWRHRC